MILRTNYLEQIKPFIGKNIIKILIGVRRSGKSTLMEQVRDSIVASGVESSCTLHINLESAAHASLVSYRNLYDYIAEAMVPQKKNYVFIDEIQEVQGWEKALRSLLVDFDVDLYVTGSNSQLLSSELATYITGRYVEIPVYPLSFVEFLEGLSSQGVKMGRQEAFLKFLVQGGFPFQYELSFEDRPTLQYLGDVYNAVLLKDVVQRNAVRDAGQLERITDYVIEQVGHTLSAKSISDYLKSEKLSISVDTIYNYLRFAEAACLLYRVKREDAVGKRALKFNEKFYLVDQGLRSARGFSNVESIDQVLENIVFMELKRRGYEVTVGKVGEREIDFIAKKGSEVAYFQVCYLLSHESTFEREFGALEAIQDNHPKYVLSLDPVQRNVNGIKNLNIADWLCGEE